MEKFIVLLLVSVAMLSGCGESEQERKARESMEELKKQAEKTAEILRDL